MTNKPHEIDEFYKGAWCDENLAVQQEERSDDVAGMEYYGSFLRELWASALIKGDLKSAHKLWGKWQSVLGRDPWEDAGWSNFWELQHFGERLWEDFNAAKANDNILLRAFLSYWPGTDTE